MAHFLVDFIRKVALIFFSAQLVLSLQRLAFDFLGYIWLLVIIGIAQLIFVIVGIFGAHQQKAKYLFCYTAWAVIWVILNIIVLVLYIEAGSFSHSKDWLSFGQGNKSWYASHGIGCKSVQEPNSLQKTIKGCVMDFKYAEIIQAALQIIMSIIGCPLAMKLRKRIIMAKDVFVVGRINPYAAYITSNDSATISRSSAITTEYPM